MSANPQSGFRIKTALLFVARAVVLFAVLMIVWHVLFPCYHEALVGIANGGLMLLQVRDRIELRTVTDHEKLYIGVFHRDHTSMREYLFSFARESLRTHIPLLLALILASPLPWARRGPAAVFGMVLMTAVEVAAACINLCWVFSTIPLYRPFNPFPSTSWTTTAADVLYYGYSLIGVYALPLLIWAFLCLRGERASGTRADIV